MQEDWYLAEAILLLLDVHSTEQQKSLSIHARTKAQKWSFFQEAKFVLIAPQRNNWKREIMRRTKVAVIDFPNTL
jgi:hypothetical protein